MPEARRRAIAAIARRHGVWVIEDDVYGDLVEDGPPALTAWLPQRACYVTSLTKTVVSGLRAGYLVAPPALVPRLVRRIRTTSWMATPLVAAIASRWIETGTAAELVTWQREALRVRQVIVRQVLGRYALRHHPTALHAWLELPPPWRAEAFVAEARLENVAITPAQPFVPGNAEPPNGIRISLGAARSEAEFRAGLGVLADLLERQPEPFYMPT
jgi:DNA-binding transcriptional MocR family regulator